MAASILRDFERFSDFLKYKARDILLVLGIICSIEIQIRTPHANSPVEKYFMKFGRCPILFALFR